MATDGRLTRFFNNLWLTVGMVGILIIAFVFDVHLEKTIERASDRRHLTLLLADELRQSSDDLTRMVRTYVVTGDPIYKKNFQDILDIRNGKQPRPAGYQRIYWDFVVAGIESSQTGRDQSIALLDLIRATGVAEEELRKLVEAKAGSDKLAIIEFEAMKLAESTGPNVEAARAKALQMLFDSNYLQAKVAIMRPINEFYGLLDKRTANIIQANETWALIWRAIFMAFGLGLIFMLWRTYAALRATLGGDIGEVHAQIKKIGSGDFSFTPLVSNAGSVLAWLSETQTKLITIDRERIQVEQVLAQFKDTLDQTLDCIFIFRQDDFCFTYVNEGAKRQIGYTEAELLRMTPLDIKLEFTLQRFQQMVRPLIDGTQPSCVFQTVHRHKNGQDIAVEVALQFMCREGREPRFVAIVRDITERKRAEEALLQVTDRLSLATRAGGVGIWDWNIVQNILTWDEQMFILYGGTRDCFGGAYETWKVSVHPEDVQQADAEVQMALRGEKDFNTEFRVLWPDGTIHNICALGSIRRDASGQPVRMIGMNWDITERRQAEARILLEQEFQVYATAMRELLTHAEQLREEDRKYIAREVHDELGQILAVLRMDIMLLQDDKNMEDAEKDDIETNMLVLVDKAIQGVRNVTVNLRPAALEMGVIPAIKGLCDEFSKHSGIRCILHAPESQLVVDEEQTVAIFRIVQESLTNVTRHAAASCVEVTLTQNAGVILAEVRDNGKGFDATDIAKQKSFGLLGMRERAIALGGSVGISSVWWQGTKITIRLPIKRNEGIA